MSDKIHQKTRQILKLHTNGGKKSKKLHATDIYAESIIIIA